MFEDFRLKVFLTAAEEGSFTRAAKVLGISQPSVSQNVSALEKGVGAQLLKRNRNEVTLTPAGRTFKVYAEKILYWYASAEAMAASEGFAGTGRLVRISADPVLGSYMLPRALSLLHGANPEFSFEISGGGDADVVLSTAPSPEIMDFEGESKLLGVMDAAVVASPLNPMLAKAASSEAKPFSTLAGVHVGSSFAVWDRYIPLLSPDIAARVRVRSASLEALKALVAGSSDLAAILPAMAVSAEVGRGELLLLPVQLPEFAFDIHFEASELFAGRQVCQLLRSTLKDVVYGL